MYGADTISSTTLSDWVSLPKTESRPESSSEDLHTWITPVRNRLQYLSTLTDNWDSHGARKVDLDLANSAFDILNILLADGGPIPSIVPTVTGGIQMEWHANVKHLEIEVVSPIMSFVSYVDGDEVEDSEVSYQLDEMLNYLNDLQSR